MRGERAQVGDKRGVFGTRLLQWLLMLGTKTLARLLRVCRNNFSLEFYGAIRIDKMF